MLLALLLGFAFGFIGSMPIAGPIALLVFAYGARGRARSGFYIALGAALAESLYAFVAFWGFAELLRRYPLVVPVSRALGALVLLATGAYLVARRRRDDRGGPASERPTPKKRGGKLLLGFTITALNPTLLVTWTAAVTALSSALGRGLRTAEALPFASGACAGIVGWFAVLLVLMRTFRTRLSPLTLDRIARGAGALLIGLGVWFAISFALGVARGGAPPV
jgi:threonine/homoserine/homoserine lactone efflux protein